MKGTIPIAELPDYIHRCNKFTEDHAEVDKNVIYNITTAQAGSEAFYSYQSQRRKERYNLAKMEYEFKTRKETKDLLSRKELRESITENKSQMKSEKRRKKKEKMKLKKIEKKGIQINKFANDGSFLTLFQEKEKELTDKLLEKKKQNQKIDIISVKDHPKELLDNSAPIEDQVIQNDSDDENIINNNYY